MDRLISSWQKIGDSVNYYTYYSYDDMGRAYKSDFCLMGTAGGTLTQTYEYKYDNTDGSLTDMDITVNGSTEESIHFEYDTLKRVNRKSLFLKGDDIEYFYTYQSLMNGRKTNLISEYSIYANYGTQYAFTYTYDEVGNITEIRNNGELVAEYTYDEQGQLISETVESENIGYYYWYDSSGNILGASKYNLATGATISTDNYVYGDENGWHDRLTSFNGGSITYDTIGNPLSYYNGKDAYYFVWQNGRELASASYGHSTITYKYGADGLRVQKTVDGAVHDYYYSDGLLVREVITYNYGYVEILDFLYDESGTPYSFIYGFVYNGNVYTTQYYYVKNLQNDVIAIVDEYGNMAVEYTYDAWGNVLYINEYLHDCIGAINPIRYRSYYYDGETGFYYLQTRYYDPAIRRFINADGYVNANGDILGFNMYTYCGNNPVMNVDYTGEFGIGALIAITLASVIIGGAAQLISNALAGETGEDLWKGVAGAAIGAGVNSLVLCLAAPLGVASYFVAGAASAIAQNTVNEVENHINGQDFKFEEFLYNTGTTYVFNTIGNALGAGLIPTNPGWFQPKHFMSVFTKSYGQKILGQTAIGAAISATDNLVNKMEFKLFSPRYPTID